MNISKNTVATINYTLKNDKGETLDTSEGREPLIYLHGFGGLIPGLEAELDNKSKNDKFTVVVEPKDAYGTRRDDLVKIVSKDGFQGDEELLEGMQVQLDTENGPAIALVSKVEGEEITLDLNHPLADKTLHFDVEVVDLREGTEEEIEHGHVHGPGGHHH